MAIEISNFTKNTQKTNKDILLEEEALAYADAQAKTGIQGIVDTEGAAINTAVPLGNKTINLPDDVRLAADDKISAPDIATPEEYAASPFGSISPTFIRNRQQDEAAPTVEEYRVAQESDKGKVGNKLTDFISQTQTTIQNMVTLSREDTSNNIVPVPSLSIGKPHHDWVSRHNFQNNEENFDPSTDVSLDQRIDRVLDTFTGRVEPGSDQVSSQFANSVALAVLAAANNTKYQREVDPHAITASLKEQGVSKQDISSAIQQQVLDQAEFQPGQTARVVTEVLTETQGVSQNGGATERDMEFFVNTYLKSLSNRENPLVSQVKDKDGAVIGEKDTSRLAYFTVNPRLNEIIDKSDAVGAVLKRRLVREPSVLPQQPVSLEERGKSGVPRATTAENLKGGKALPNNANQLVASLLADGEVSPADSELLDQLGKASEIYEEALVYVDTLPLHVEKGVTSAATQKAVMVKADLESVFNADANRSIPPGTFTVGPGPLRGTTVSLYSNTSQFPTSLFGVTPQGIQFKYSKHPFANLFDLDQASLLKRLNSTRPSGELVFENSEYLNGFNNEMVDPWSSLEEVQASINKIITEFKIDPVKPYGASFVATERGTIEVASDQPGQPSDTVKAIMQGELLSWLTTATEEFLQVGNDKLASVFELAGLINSPSQYIKHKQNATNLRSGMTTTTLNPQNYVWQRAALTNPNPTLVYRPTFTTEQDVEHGAYLSESFTRKNPEELRSFKAGISRNLFDWLESEPDYNVRAAMFDHFLLNQPIDVVAKRYASSAQKIRKYTTHKEYSKSLEMAKKYRRASKIAHQMANANINKVERIEAVSQLGQAYLRKRKGQNEQGNTVSKASPYHRRGLTNLGGEAKALLELTTSITPEDIQLYADAFGKSKEAPLVDTSLIHLGDYLYGAELGGNKSFLTSRLVVEQDGASNNYAYLAGLLGIPGLAKATRLLAPEVVENADGTWQYEDIRGYANAATFSTFHEAAKNVNSELGKAYEQFYNILESDHSLRKDFWKSILMEFGYSRAADSFIGEITQKFDVDSEKYSAIKNQKDNLIELLSNNMETALGSALGDTNAYASFMKVGGVIASVLGEDVIIRNQINYPLILSQFEALFDQHSHTVNYKGQPVLNINQPVRTRVRDSTRERLNTKTGEAVPNSQRYDQASKASVVTIHGADSATLAQVFRLAAQLKLWGYGVFDAIVADANSAGKFAELYNRIQKADIKRWSTTPIEDVQAAVSKGTQRLEQSIKKGEPDVNVIASLALDHTVIEGDFDTGLEHLSEIKKDSDLGKTVAMIREFAKPYFADDENIKSISKKADKKKVLGDKLTDIIKKYPGGIKKFSQDLVNASFFSIGGHVSIPYSTRWEDGVKKTKIKEGKLKQLNDVASELKALVRRAQHNATDLHGEFHKYDGGNLG